MPPIAVKTGQSYGRLTVLARIGTTAYKHPVFQCLCACGRKIETTSAHLRSGNTQSCGCLKAERSRRWAPKMSRNYWKLPEEGWALRRLLGIYRRSALKRGIPFDLSTARFSSTIIEPCFYCGSTRQNRLTSKGRSYLYTGLDRKDNSAGYTTDNVVPCCRACNVAKHGLSYESFVAWAAAVVKHQRKSTP